ncbi:MAG: hypothetical protein EOP00_02845 [Pedobacter sp.]|nr:MAG: hypothetical protein EOP00_02845 [Pedobacter sp.]
MGKIKRFFAKINNTLNYISTAPERTSWEWGSYISVLSFVFLRAIWLLRIFSVLQLLKIVVRERIRIAKIFTAKHDSKRADVPPGLQEIYFSLWLFLLLLFACSLKNLLPFQVSLSPKSIKIFATYFLIESSVWIIYYTILRRFFEERYSIYHPIEYFVLIPIVMSGQALALSIIYSLSLDDSFLILMGLSDNAKIQFYIKMIGILYLAFVLSMIINGFPSEKRKSDNFFKVAIIGYGDVVRNRILPALMQSSVRQNRIEIYTDDMEEKAAQIHKIKNLETEFKNIIKCKMIWICTPSFSHIEYLEKLYSSKSFLVMEKPITIIKQELNLVRRLKKNGCLENVFFLSYYQLEKALTLTYLVRPTSFYEKYLIFDSSKAKLFENYQNLGQLKKICIYMAEGEDKRVWPHQSENGGQLLETFLHHMVIATQFLSLPSTWNEVTWKVENNGVVDQSQPSIIIFYAKAGDTTIELAMVKNASKSELFRGAKLTYEKGTINADFDKKQLELHAGKAKNVIATNQKYNHNYAIQTDLAITSFENQISPWTIDGYENQLEIIEWLIIEKEKLIDSVGLYPEIINIKERFKNHIA